MKAATIPLMLALVLTAIAGATTRQANTQTKTARADIAIFSLLLLFQFNSMATAEHYKLGLTNFWASAPSTPPCMFNHVLLIFQFV